MQKIKLNSDVREVTQATSNLLEFYRAYIEAALWSSTDYADDSGGEPLDLNYDHTDISAETLDQMLQDCAAFLLKVDHLINFQTCRHKGCSEYAYAGHDFWLTRNGHGAGFWDGDWEDEAGKQLTKIAKEFGTFDLYIGDDGQIWGHPLK